MADLTQNAPEVFIGRLDGKLDHLRFIHVDESPEIEIDHLFDRWPNKAMHRSREAGRVGNGESLVAAR